jgi:hypothetical protein
MRVRRLAQGGVIGEDAEARALLLRQVKRQNVSKLRWRGPINRGAER